jgi:hypothetical protein
VEHKGGVVRTIQVMVLLATVAGEATGQMRPTGGPVSVRRPATSGVTEGAAVAASLNAAAERVSTALDDTSAMRRERAVSAIRRAAPSTRMVAVQKFAEALAAQNPVRRARAMSSLELLVAESAGQPARFDGGADLGPAVPALARIANDPADPLRSSALLLLAESGRVHRGAFIGIARTATADGNAAVREAAYAALGAVGDSADVARAIVGLADRSPDVRARAARALGSLGRGDIVPPLIKALSDSSRFVRGAAVNALGRLGSRATPALPRILQLVTDSSEWRSSAGLRETVGAEAAWAASHIVPRRGLATVPARVEIDDRDALLRSDGFGAYVTGADSVKAFVAGALNLDLSGIRGDGRAARLIGERNTRRSLTFDLSRPARGARGPSIGVVTDREAMIRIFWQRPVGKPAVSMAALEPSDRAGDIERAEFEFRIGGEPYLLQMGSWAASEFDTRVPRVNGRGTSTPRLYHLNADEWTVVAPPGSVARLWNVADPAKPVDLGLYEFSFGLTWSGLTVR